MYNSSCQLCVLRLGARTVCVPGRGSKTARIIIVGEAPGQVEDEQGKPFVGPSGALLDDVMVAAGLNPEDVFITNAAKCRPPANRTPDIRELAACVPTYLYEEIVTIRPIAVVTLGKTATLAVTGRDTRIGELRGRPLPVKLRSKGGVEHEVTVVPSWHPAYVLRNPSARAELVSDVSVAVSLLSPRTTDYRYLNSVDEALGFLEYLRSEHKDNRLPRGAVAVDLETTDIIRKVGEFSADANKPGSHIGSIQIAYDDGKAVLIPVVRPGSVFDNPRNGTALRDGLKLLFDEVPIVGHNFIFDATYLYRKLGLMPRSLLCDTLLAHHFLRVDEKLHGLDALIPRYLGRPSHKGVMNAALHVLPPESRSYANVDTDVLVKYGCDDADATLALYVEFRRRLESLSYSRFVGRKVFFKNAWDAFQTVVMYSWRAFAVWQTNGVCLDAAVFPKIDAELTKQIHDVESEVRESPFHRAFLAMTRLPNQSRSKAIKEFRWLFHCRVCGHRDSMRPPKPKGYKCAKCTAAAESTWFERRMLPTGEVVVDESQPEFVSTPLSLSSNPQKQRFIYDVMRLPELQHPKDRDKVRAVDKTMREMLIAHCEDRGLAHHIRILELFGEHSKASKLKSSYVDSIPTFIPVKTVEDSLPHNTNLRHLAVPAPLLSVHTQFKQWGTVSGRPSCEDPPMMTIPRKSVIKESIVSRFPNGVILQGDFAQAEVRGFVIETGDPALREAFDRGTDPHKTTAAKAFDTPVSAVTDEQRQAAKIVLFGLLYGRSAAAIAAQINKPVAYAQAIIDDWFASAPEVAKWVSDIQRIARRDKATVSLLGRIRWLDEFYSSDALPFKIAEGNRRAVNTPIQGLAADLCTTSAAAITYRIVDLGIRSAVVLTVYDSVIVDVHPADLPVVYDIVREEMVDNVSKRFPFVSIRMNTDIEIGPNWGTPTKISKTSDGALRLSAKSMPRILDIVSRLSSEWVVRTGSPLIRVDESGKVVGAEVDLHLSAATPREASLCS